MCYPLKIKTIIVIIYASKQLGVQCGHIRTIMPSLDKIKSVVWEEIYFEAIVDNLQQTRHNTQCTHNTHPMITSLRLRLAKKQLINIAN